MDGKKDKEGEQAREQEEVDWGEMLPRLTRFYGGEAKTWMNETPVIVMRAYLSMLPTLEAEERFEAAEQISIGTGSMRKDDANVVTTRWRNALERERRVVRPAGPEQLAAVGIGYRKAKKQQHGGVED